jgi:fatty-acyl-CoA synthase
VDQANVYGVGVPGAEGRVGMAALVVSESFDIDGFARHVLAKLAGYARPVFLRMTAETDATSTFKQRKTDLVHQGFDPAATTDDLYFLHPELQTYVRLTPALYGQICDGKVRL